MLGQKLGNFCCCSCERIELNTISFWNFLTFTRIENCTSLVAKQELHQTGRSTNLFKSNNISLIPSHDDSPLKCAGRWAFKHSGYQRSNRSESWSFYFSTLNHLCSWYSFVICCVTYKFFFFQRLYISRRASIIHYFFNKTKRKKRFGSNLRILNVRLFFTTIWRTKRVFSLTISCHT